MSSTVRIPVSFSCREPAPGDYPLCAWIAGCSNRWHDFHVVQIFSCGRWPSIWTHWVHGAEIPTKSPAELLKEIEANKPATDDPRWKGASVCPPTPRDFPIWVSSRGWARQNQVPEEAGISLLEVEEDPSLSWAPETRWFSASTPYPELPEVPTIGDRRPTKAELERGFEKITSGEIQAGDWLSGCNKWAFGMIGREIGDSFSSREGSVYRRKPKVPAPQPAPAPTAEPISPPLAVGDRVKLITDRHLHEDYSPNPTWGGPLGYVLGTLFEIREGKFGSDLPFRVRWDAPGFSYKTNSYANSDLARATAADEKLAEAWALPVPEGWRALGTDEKIVDGDCWIETAGQGPIEAMGAILAKLTVASAFLEGRYNACKFIRRVDTLKASEAQSPTSFQADKVTIFPTSDDECPAFTTGETTLTPTARYVAGLQRKNEAQRKALAALHEKVAELQDELKESRAAQRTTGTGSGSGYSCPGVPEPWDIREELNPTATQYWSKSGLLAEKNRLKKEPEDWLERGRKNLEIIKAALSDDEKFSLTFAYPSYAEFLADLITGLKRKLEAAEAKSAAAVKQLATRDEQVARQAKTIANYQQSQRTPLPDTVGIPQAGDRWKDGRTGVVWAPEAALESLHDQLSAAEARASERENQILNINRWLVSEWKRSAGCPGFLSEENQLKDNVGKLLYCWNNQRETLGHQQGQRDKADLLDRAVVAVPGSTPEGLVDWLEAMELTRRAG